MIPLFFFLVLFDDSEYFSLVGCKAFCLVLHKVVNDADVLFWRRVVPIQCVHKTLKFRIGDVISPHIHFYLIESVVDRLSGGFVVHTVSKFSQDGELI